jgi:hypothetical protein
MIKIRYLGSINKYLIDFNVNGDRLSYFWDAILDVNIFDMKHVD